MAKEFSFWVDTVAEEVMKKWKVPSYRTEMGLGASGVPHVGSAGDAVRSYVVARGIQDRGRKSELIAYSDDRDGLRRVPQGFSASLEREIGKPVSLIPDPFKCHKSFSLHITSLLIDAFEKLGIEFTLRRGDEEYRKGTLDKEIIEILSHAKEAGEIIKRETGSEKFLHQLPFLPICSSCRRIYTTRATTFLPREKKVQYTCDLEFRGKARGREVQVKGCGREGEVSIREGKLAWKVEFAARWRALDIHYEAYGKDILDSVRCNDAICRELLGRDPPVHSFYELFTERGGEKISKSKGNVFTPQMWMEVASPQSLRLLFLKRLGTTRVVDLDAIPALMDELDSLERVYFGEESVANKKELSHKKRLFEYIHFLHPPKKQTLRIEYNTLVHLAQSLPIKEKENLIKEILFSSGKIKQLDKESEKELQQRIHYASRWAGEEPPPKEKIVLNKAEKKALAELYEVLKSPLTAEEIQTQIFGIAKQRGFPPKNFFRLLYKILLGMEKGPRAGKLIELLGREKVRKLIKQRL